MGKYVGGDMNNIIVALIGAGASLFVGILTLVGVVITTKKQSEDMSRDIQHRLETSQAVTETKLEELTREVREHNGFARRMPVVEEQIRVANHRIRDLEDEIYHEHHKHQNMVQGGWGEEP